MQLACYEYMSNLDRLYAQNKNVMGICYDNQRIIYAFPNIKLAVYSTRNEVDLQL